MKQRRCPIIPLPREEPHESSQCLTEHPMRGLKLRRDDHTSPVIWLIAIVCTVLAISVIVAGLAVLAVYLIYRPKMPYLTVTYAHLNRLDYDQSGLLDTELALTIVANNANSRVHASFSDFGLEVGFHGVTIAVLRAAPFEVAKNNTVALPYVVPSSPIPLDESGMEAMAAALQRDRVMFRLDGQARTRWRVGIFLSARFWTHLSCGLEFAPSNMSSLGLDCSSKSH